MTRRIRSLNKGRLTVWWVTHRQDAIRAAQLVTIVGLYMVASHMDYSDAIAQERSMRERAEEQAELMKPLAEEYPQMTFVLQARTRQDAIDRMAEVEGMIAAERYSLRWGVK
jgi:hypothetical protein